KLIFKSSATSRKIVYRTLLTPDYRDYCKCHATGTTNLGLSREDFLAYPIPRPTQEVQQFFDRIIGSLESRAATAVAESRLLSSTRDALLPKLLSGEIRVKDAERWVGEERIEEVVEEPEEKPVKREEVREEETPEEEPEREGPVPLEEVETEEVMAAIRQILREHKQMTREDLHRQVAYHFGYQRLGSRVEETLRGHVRAAIRRKIAQGNGEEIWLETPTMAHYAPEELIDTLCSVMKKGREYDREEVLESAAHHLGFTRVRDSVKAPLKSALNGGIRRGRIGYQGKMIWREEG
ncbi:MAG: hypothetical protein KC994_26990, partial [Candidatus Omnitrophica bacterium]|nr:hypothetical protein [Candidatus Omnitrophota bacterium]